MSLDRKTHDLKNALLFLETFPSMIKQLTEFPDEGDMVGVDELLQIYSEKLKVVKDGLGL
jgi:hypothetical protein